MQLKFAREEVQTSGRKCSHLFRELIRGDLDEAVRNTNDDRFFGADNIACNSAERSLGLRDGEHLHKSDSKHDLKQVKLMT